MSTPFLSEIRVLSFNFPPKGWALCNGQLLPINQNQALFALLGTTFGGNGQTTFALPNLQGRTPVHMGDGLVLGQTGGQEQVQLNTAQLPPHHHTSGTGDQATSTDPAGAVLASKPRRGTPIYASPTNLAANGTVFVGGGMMHPNMPPYLVLSFAIALQGIFPSQN